MALGVSQDFSWTVRGCEVISFFVCLVYVSNAALNMVSKLVEVVVEDRTDMWSVEESVKLVSG